MWMMWMMWMMRVIKDNSVTLSRCITSPARMPLQAQPNKLASQPACGNLTRNVCTPVHQSTSPEGHHHLTTTPTIYSINFLVSCPCKDLSYSPTVLYCIHLFTLTTNQQSFLLPSTLPNLDVTLLKPPSFTIESCTGLASSANLALNTIHNSFAHHIIPPRRE